jgi:outer membrane protein assembly factor BamD (BamD/ComL family)
MILVFLFTYACSTAQKDYDMARQVDTVAAYQDFLNKHPQSDFTESARTRIEKKNFEMAETENTVAAYQRFIDDSDSDLFKNYANQRILKLYTDNYEKAKAADTIEAYEQYLKNYPQSMFSKDSLNRIDAIMWSLTIKGKSALSYYRYLYNCKYCRQHDQTAQKRLQRAAKSGDKINFAYVKQKIQKIIQRNDIVVVQSTPQGTSSQTGPIQLTDVSNTDEILVSILTGTKEVSSDDLAQGTYQSRPKMRLKNSLPIQDSGAIGFNTIIIYPEKGDFTEVIFISGGNAYAFNYKGVDIY